MWAPCFRAFGMAGFRTRQASAFKGGVLGGSRAPERHMGAHKGARKVQAEPANLPPTLLNPPSMPLRPPLPLIPAASIYGWYFWAIAWGILIASILQQWSFAAMGQASLPCAPCSRRAVSPCGFGAVGGWFQAVASPPVGGLRVAAKRPGRTLGTPTGPFPFHVTTPPARSPSLRSTSLLPGARAARARAAVPRHPAAGGGAGTLTARLGCRPGSRAATPRMRGTAASNKKARGRLVGCRLRRCHPNTRRKRPGRKRVIHERLMFCPPHPMFAGRGLV